MDQPTFSNRHIFIVGEDVLLDEGIAHLLTTRTEMRISREKYKDESWLVDSVLQRHPDVILLAESGALGSTRLLDLLFSIPTLKYSRVVVTRLENNMVDVYECLKQMDDKNICSRQQFDITHRDELVAIVQGNFDQISARVISLLP